MRVYNLGNRESKGYMMNLYMLYYYYYLKQGEVYELGRVTFNYEFIYMYQYQYWIE